MDLKSFRLTGLKAYGDQGADDLKPGQFKAYASTWTREPDSYGDVVTKGAFLDTIEAWKSSGNALPLLFGHDLNDPFSNLGEVLEMEEDDHGLLTLNQLDLENPKAAQVHRMLKGRRINQMSFAYSVLDSAILEEDGKQIRDLKKLDLYEISVVPVGANSDTEVLAVKSLAEAFKSGRTLTPQNLATLTSARDVLDTLLKSAGANDNHETDSGTVEAKAQEGKASADRQKSALASVAYTTAI